MEYAALVDHFERLEATTKRLERTAILAEALAGLAPDEMEPAFRLLVGKVAPDWEGVELGLAEKLVLSGIMDVSGRSIKEVQSLYHETGDLGTAAELSLSGVGKKKKQVTFDFSSGTFSEERSSLEITEIYDRLCAIAGKGELFSLHTSGHGSQQRKKKILEDLLLNLSPREAKYIIRTVAGRLRLGVADMTFLDALTAWHRRQGVKSVTEMEPEEREEHEDVRRRLERAYDLRSDLAFVAKTLAEGGLAAIDGVQVRHGTPLRPMAAERLKTLGEVLEKHTGRSALEYKYDGLRVQAHVSADPEVPVKLFSRRMEDLTHQFPDVQQHLRAALRGKSAIVEGECVAIDRDTGRMRPFQEISRRRGRKTGLGEDARREAALAEGARTALTMMDQIPVTVFLFDCMAADGESVMHEPYERRRDRVGEVFALGDDVRLSTMQVCEDEAAMEAFFLQAVADGAEGVMCKALDAPYKAGNRGYDWIKYKTDYTAELVDTMDLVAVGAFYGRGRRAGWYGALLMAAYDPDTDTYASVCKLGTGFDDATLMGLRDRFETYASTERPRDVDSLMVPDVWLRPAVVMEVQAAELTLSPTHRAGWGTVKPGAGLAARFPRFTVWRDDKAPEQATTVQEIRRMYELQGHRPADPAD